MVDRNGTDVPGVISPRVHEAEWFPRASNNCTFSYWQVQRRYVPRSVPFGILDLRPDGTEWEDLCIVTDNRSTTSCSFSVRTNREYRLRVRELCEDSLANSVWVDNEETCRSAPVSALPPVNLTCPS